MVCRIKRTSADGVITIGASLPAALRSALRFMSASVSPALQDASANDRIDCGIPAAIAIRSQF
jgi:hypothetical protein